MTATFLPGAPTGQKEGDIDSTTCIAIMLNVGIILTTIHTQNYKDVLRDAAAGRITLPIAHPALSRAVIAILILWLWGVSRTWRLG